MIYTSDFNGPYGNHPNAFAISRSVPPGWEGKRCMILAPPRCLIDMYKTGTITWKDFSDVYKWYLEQVNMESVLWSMEQECPEQGTPDIYLLCHEPPGQKCHRRLVAEEIEKQFKIPVREAKQ